MSKSKRDSKRNEGLSAEELKRKMYHSLQSAGVVSQLKGYLRQSVINELRGGSKEDSFLEKSDLLAATIRKRADIPWNRRAMDNLVLQHLKQSRYQYSLSLFQQESGIVEYDKSLTEDLLQQLGVSPSLLHESVGAKGKENNCSMDFSSPHVTSAPESRDGADREDSKFLLWKILSNVCSPRHLVSQFDEDAVMRETERQTKQQPRKLTLAEKLQAIDDEMDATLRERRLGDVEHRKSIATLASATQRAEQAAEKHARETLEQWKKIELTRVMVEEAEKAKKQVAERTKELEEDFSHRKEALLQREQNAIDRLNNQKEILEKDLHHQRQVLLGELDQIRMREKTLQEKEQMMRDIVSEDSKLEIFFNKKEFMIRQENNNQTTPAVLIP